MSMTTVRQMMFVLGANTTGFDAGVTRASARADQLKGRLAGGAVAADRLRLGLFAAGFAGAAALRAATSEASAYEATILRASFATGAGTAEVGRLTQSTRALGREFAMAPSQAAKLQLAINNMGISRIAGEASGLNVELAETAARFSHIAEVDAAKFAKTLFRVSLLTNTTKEAQRESLAAAEEWAGAVLIAGRNSAAGAAQVATFLEKLVQTGTVLNLTEKQMIALAGTFATVDENAPERVATSLLRIFSDEMLDNAKVFADFFGMTVEQFEVVRRNDPTSILLGLGQAFADAAEASTESGGQFADAAEVMKALGFESQRDKRTMSAFAAALQVYNRIMDETGGETAGTIDLMEQWRAITETLSFKWMQFVANLRAAGEMIGTTLAPALKTVLDALTGIANVVASNPAVAGALGMAGIGIVGRSVLSSGLFGAAAITGAGGPGLRGFGGGPFAMFASARFRKSPLGKSGLAERLRENEQGPEPLPDLALMGGSFLTQLAMSRGMFHHSVRRTTDKTGADRFFERFGDDKGRRVGRAAVIERRIADEAAGLVKSGGFRTKGLVAGGIMGEALMTGLMFMNPARLKGAPGAVKSMMKAAPGRFAGGLRAIPGLLGGGRLGTMIAQGFQGGMIGAAPAGGRLARFASGMGGKALARGVGMVIPGVGIASMLALLEPLTSGLGKMFDTIGDGMPILRPFTELLAMTFKILELGGAAVNRVGRMIMGWWEDFKKTAIGQGIAHAFDALGEFISKGNGFIDEATEWMNSDKPASKHKVEIGIDSAGNVEAESTTTPSTHTAGAPGTGNNFVIFG